MTKKYSVILADPPWQFKTYSDKGKGRSADRHYSTMTLSDICALPVVDFLEDNAALFLWCIWPSIFDAKQVGESWGFTYRALAWEWIKLTQAGEVRMGMGYYTRSNCEPCLLFVKGSMPVVDKSIKNILVAYYTQHSQKPSEQYDLIQRLYPEGNRLELFARHKQPGWDVWGNEIGPDITLPGWREHSKIGLK